MIVIVDLGMGNLRSISHKLEKLGVQAIISSDPRIVLEARHIILPGVGNFGSAMKQLRSLDLLDSLNTAVLGRGVPVLGICLGMQLFARTSEEGDAVGLGWLDAEVVRFNFSDAQQQMRVPHVGWNTLQIQHASILTEELGTDQRFYFTHSYHIICPEQNVLATTNYGFDFVSAVRHKNIFGVQFHPEKSHRRGIQIIKNFLEKSQA